MNDLISISKSKKIMAVFTAVMVAVLLLLSGFFIITHTEHECIGEDCPVCTQMESREHEIRLLTQAVGMGDVLAFAYILTEIIILLYLAGLELCPVSLVSLKIRLND